MLIFQDQGCDKNYRQADRQHAFSMQGQKWPSEKKS